MTRPETLAARAGIARDGEHGAVVPPIHLTSTFAFADFERQRTYDYTRSGNPTRDLLAESLAGLEGGAGAVVTASGMAAVTLALQLLRVDDCVVAPHDAYGGTYRLLKASAERGHFDVALLDLTSPDAPGAIRRHRPRMVWIETPSNPLLRITDVAAVADAARDAGAIAVVDNTFLSPVWQQPIELGADIVVHSTTKYLNGHSDVVGGAVVARDAAVYEELAWWANCLGLAGSPFDAWLAMRGLRTLHARAAVHAANAAAVVELLGTHPAVMRVHYPGLASHPGHALAARQQRGHGAMVSFELRGGRNAIVAFLDGLRIFTLAESLGGVESLVAHPDTMTHASMDAEARAAAGITDTLLRLSVGIEAAEDLLADLRAGLDRAAATATAGHRTCPDSGRDPFPAPGESPWPRTSTNSSRNT